jgi:hypothetical protein
MAASDALSASSSHEVALQLDEHVGAAENADEAVEQPADAVLARVEQRAAAERDEPLGAAVELLERERPLPFRGAHLHARHQPAQVLVAALALDEHRQRPCVPRSVVGDPRPAIPGARRNRRRDRELGADDGAQPGALRRLVKARRPVDAVGIEQRDRRIAERRGALDERFRKRCALQKAEGRRRVELDVHRRTAYCRARGLRGRQDAST